MDVGESVGVAVMVENSMIMNVRPPIETVGLLKFTAW